MPTQNKNSTSFSSLQIFAVLVLTVVFTWLCVAESHRNGRLASSPNYDDCVYFYSGATLLEAIKSDGWAGVERNIAERGMHSPYSIILAACSYALFGPSESSPYYGNAVVVLIYLLGIGWFLRRLPLPTWLFFMLLFLTPPFITMGVVEFRPDIAWAVTVGFGVVYIVTAEQIFRRPMLSVFSGLLMALALLIKPSTFVMTVILFSGAACSRVLGEGIQEKWKKPPSRAAALGVLVFMSTVLLVTGPYAWTYGESTWNYFIENSFGGNREVWAYRGNFTESLFYYIFGQGSRSNVHVTGWIVLVTGILSAAYLAWQQPGHRWRLLTFACLIFCALTINTFAEMKSPFLGGAIYGVSFFACAWVIAESSRHFSVDLDRQSRIRLTKTRAVTLLLAVCFYHWPSYSDWGRDQARCENYRVAHKHMQQLLDQHKQNPPKSILFAQAGPIVMEATGLWFPFNNLEVKLGSAAFYRTEREFIDAYPGWDWVVIQEQGVMGCSENMPSENLLFEFLAIIRADQRFTAISEFTSLNGKKVWIFSAQS